MLKTLTEGFLLGLTTGTTCLVTCTPIYLPFIVAEKRSILHNLFKVMEIPLGRFVSYLAFGAAAGYLGGSIASLDRTLFTGIAYILITVFMFLSFFRLTRKEKSCHIPRFVNFTKSAFLLGVFTGINFCPSFLIALSKAVDLAGPISGILLFLGFFFGTSIFLIPLAFSGFLSKVQLMKHTARYASIAVALYFLYSGVHHIISYSNSLQARIIDPIAPEYRINLYGIDSDSLYYNALADSLSRIKGNGFKHFRLTENIEMQLASLAPDTIILIAPELVDAEVESILAKHDHYIMNPHFPVPEAILFLRTYSIKVGKNQFLIWKM
jgi:sulfite exporter TauE/SafE